MVSVSSVKDMDMDIRWICFTQLWIYISAVVAGNQVKHNDE